MCSFFHAKLIPELHRYRFYFESNNRKHGVLVNVGSTVGSRLQAASLSSVEESSEDTAGVPSSLRLSFSFMEFDMVK